MLQVAARGLNGLHVAPELCTGHLASAATRLELLERCVFGNTERHSAAQICLMKMTDALDALDRDINSGITFGRLEPCTFLRTS